MAKNILYNPQYDEFANRLVVRCDNLIVGNTLYDVNLLILDRIDNIKNLLLTIGNGLRYNKEEKRIYTEVPIKMDQLITYYNGRIVPISKDINVGGNDDELNVDLLADEIDSRLFLPGYNIQIYHDNNGTKLDPNKGGIGAGGYLREDDQHNVDITFIDTDYNLLNSGKYQYIDSKTINDIISGNYTKKKGMRIEDRLVLLKATKDIPINTELLIHKNTIKYWNDKLEEYNKHVNNTRILIERQIGLSPTRAILEIEQLKIKNIRLKNKRMLLSDLTNLKHLFFTIGKELSYKPSTIPKAGKGLFTNVDIKKDQIITVYEGYTLKINSQEFEQFKGKNDYISTLIKNEYVIIGNYDENGKKINLEDSKNLKNKGGGAFMNDNSIDKNENNTDFITLFNDFYYLNREFEKTNFKRPYIDNRFLSDILTGKAEYTTKSRPFDAIIIFIAKEDIIGSENTELFTAYGEEYWKTKKK